MTNKWRKRIREYGREGYSMINVNIFDVLFGVYDNEGRFVQAYKSHKWAKRRAHKVEGYIIRYYAEREDD